ncbi:MAG: hypothetical protein E7546_06680 [Ruminococcaceae bacterium]|nr:hypothetical protein [Oscillospiraceae bacterium]
MKKRFILVALILALSMLLTSCLDGYNDLMYEYLSDSNNYMQYEVTLVDIYYRDEDGEICEDYKSEDIKNSEHVYFSVYFHSKHEVAPFLGLNEDNLQKECDEYIVNLQIEPNNNKILYENGFYSDIEENTDISLKTSNWIYMDGFFFYVISVTYNDTDYLNESDGLENIVAMMKENPSLI